MGKKGLFGWGGECRTNSVRRGKTPYGTPGTAWKLPFPDLPRFESQLLQIIKPYPPRRDRALLAGAVGFEPTNARSKIW
jgi:hypothetical protein